MSERIYEIECRLVSGDGTTVIHSAKYRVPADSVGEATRLAAGMAELDSRFSASPWAVPHAVPVKWGMREQVANEFCRILNSWLSSVEIAEINRLNATKEYSDCCASHNFCDSNMAMIEALEKFGRRGEYSPLSQDAWTMAKERGFAVLTPP